MLCISFSLAVAQNADRINNSLDEATKLYNDGNHKAAAAKFEEVLKLDPGRPSTHYNAAACYEAVGDDKKAAGHLREYLKLTPGARDRKEVESWISALEGKPGAPKPSVAAEPLVTPPSTWVVKAGLFMCGNQCQPENIDLDLGWMAGVEYWDPFKKGNMIVYGLFYSRTDYVWTPYDGSGEMEYAQLSASYLWKAGMGKSGRGSLDGLYYGLGLGYGVFNFDGDFEDSGGTLDFNGIVGYNFGNAIAAEGVWIIDESGGTLSAGYRF
ncbi:MAG: tetratricopeptide repeat protein [bacterium]